MKFSLSISNFLEDIPSLSHSVLFLYFFALIAEEGFFKSRLASLGTLHSDVYIFSFLLCLLLLFFSQLFVRPPKAAILLFASLFLGDGFDPCLHLVAQTVKHLSTMWETWV